MITATAACPVCGSTDARGYALSEDDELVTAVIGSGRRAVTPGIVLRCMACGLGYRSLRPDVEQLAELYSDLPLEPYDAEHTGRRRTAARHLAIVQQYCERGHLLDVGCASGFFLEAAAAAGWNVLGVEPSHALCVQARTRLSDAGTVIETTLEHAALEPASFDVITLWDVLEHVADPVAFLEHCRTLLRPGGYAFVNVPDLNSMQARILGKRWPLLLPEHLTYFTRRSLRLCGERAGLRWIRNGRRRVSFSIPYVLKRLEQHRIPCMPQMSRMATVTGLSRFVIPIAMGELFGVWQR